MSLTIIIFFLMLLGCLFLTSNGPAHWITDNRLGSCIRPTDVLQSSLNCYSVQLSYHPAPNDSRVTISWSTRNPSSALKPWDDFRNAAFWTSDCSAHTLLCSMVPSYFHWRFSHFNQWNNVGIWLYYMERFHRKLFLNITEKKKTLMSYNRRFLHGKF